MSDGQTFQGCPDAVRALHADIQKHHGIRPGGGSVQKCVAALVQVADDRIPHACRSSRSSRWASNFWSSTIAIRSSIATLPPCNLIVPHFSAPCTCLSRAKHPLSRRIAPSAPPKRVEKRRIRLVCPVSAAFSIICIFLFLFSHFFKKGLTARNRHDKITFDFERQSMSESFQSNLPGTAHRG